MTRAGSWLVAGCWAGLAVTAMLSTLAARVMVGCVVLLVAAAIVEHARPFEGWLDVRPGRQAPMVRPSADAAMRERLLWKLARGLDLPPELLTTIGASRDVNHWSAAHLDAEALKHYRAVKVLAGRQWGRSTMRGPVPTHVWFDEATDFSGETLRRVHGFDASDLPDVDLQQQALDLELERHEQRLSDAEDAAG